MNARHVLMAPDYRKGNPYQSLLCKSLEDRKWQVAVAHFPNGLFALTRLVRQHPGTKVLHLHWLVTVIKQVAWSKNTLLFRIKLWLLVLDIYLVRLMGCKVVWTIHNKLAHEQLNAEKELTVRRAISKAVSRVVLHSEQALQTINQLYQRDLTSKTSVIFHGSYIGVYPEPSTGVGELRAKLNLPEDARVVCHIGIMRPYKGIEKLINAFKQLEETTDLHLLIAGKPADEKYRQQLEALIGQHPRIHCHFAFLSDQQMIDYLHLSDLVCLPFSDTLTSGSALLAMSCGKALLLSESAKVFGCVPNAGAHYFDNEQALLDALTASDKQQLQQMGAANLAQAQQMTWQRVAELTEHAYLN